MNTVPEIYVGSFPLAVWQRVICYSDFPTLTTALGSVCSAMRHLTKGDLRERHKEFFEGMVADVPSFLTVLQECRGIVGGSAVLSMVCPVFRGAHDYDIFVPVDGVAALIYHLVVVEGYHGEAVERHHPANGCLVGDVRYLSGIGKQVTLSNGTIEVDIIGVGAGDAWDRADVPIASAWATILMNFVTPGDIVLTYPTLTLLGRSLIQWDRVLHPSFPGGVQVQELDKYQARGIEFRTQADEWDMDERGWMRKCGRSWVCPLVERSFGDGGCMWLSLGKQEPEVSGTKWTLGGRPCPLVCDQDVGVMNQVHVDWCVC
ncbi:hypothetical protein OH76DRAFT_1488389 [Lentinus brumalis]|uniref:Uncharacterized protein n=1 Tax=Lentinus brumalis TaxID=2498619 RepID=A0A371CR48_9APHY|nr:hypothetical protein OH76DRAFT_1488389 [Polyporus brumalis]